MHRYIETEAISLKTLKRTSDSYFITFVFDPLLILKMLIWAALKVFLIKQTEKDEIPVNG